MTSWTAETAEWYAENYGEYATNRLAVDFLIENYSNLLNVGVIVDIGCGTGCALRYLADKLSGEAPQQLIGFEPTPRMLEIAKERCKDYKDRLELREGATEYVDLPSDTVDMLLLFDVLGHVKDRPRALLEMKRILKPTGRLAIVEDGGVNDEEEAAKTLDSARKAGLDVEQNQFVEKQDVSLTLMVLKKA